MPLAERAYPRPSAHCQVGPKVTQAGCAMPRHRQTSSRQAGSASSTPSPNLLDELARKPGVELLGGRFTGQRKVRSLLPACRPPAPLSSHGLVNVGGRSRRQQTRAWIRVFEPCHWQGGGQRSSRPVAWRHASGGRTTSDPLVRHQSLSAAQVGPPGSPAGTAWARRSPARHRHRPQDATVTLTAPARRAATRLLSPPPRASSQPPLILSPGSRSVHRPSSLTPTERPAPTP